MNEVFLDIPGYEKLYQISNFGNIKNIKTGRILRPFKDKDGYLQVDLFKNGIKKRAVVHRLVAQSFIPNLTNLPQVNHKDEDKTNNFVDNLEWCDNKYNINYGTRTKRSAESHQKPILQFDKHGLYLREWSSATKANKETGINNKNISECCLGHRGSAGGYIWKYKN